MNWVAFKMLTGDRSKYLGIIFGVTFAALLIAQQASIFCGIMRRTTSQIRDVKEATIWVMNSQVEYVDDVRPISDNDVYRVRSVPGVDWAVLFYKGGGQARLDNGRFQSVILLGLDDATLVGAPETFTLGSLADLNQPDAVAIDESGYHFLWPGEPFVQGKVLEMNDRRAVVVAIFKASQTYGTSPVLVTRFSQATQFIPGERRMLPFVLVKHKEGFSAEEVARRIEEATQVRRPDGTVLAGLQARTKEQFIWQTQMRYLWKTSLPMNYGMTVLLGFVVGAAIAGQTFYLFTLENLKQFGALKAMGLNNMRIIGMILLQATVVAGIGYGLGVGGATAYGLMTYFKPMMAYYMPWQVLLGTGAAVILIAIAASLLSIRRVVVLEPAIVFRG
jgi:putative ABC transport system permease protein